MSHLLLYYQRPEPATWVFLSSFLLLSIYFVFHRFFSVRNLDIVLLLLLAPGLMMVYEGRKQKLDATESIAIESMAQDSRLRQSLVQVAENESESKLLKESTPSKLISYIRSQEEASRETVGQSATSGYQDESDAGKRLEFYGFAALLIACSLLMIRMLVDPALVRRPLLTPNLSIGGLSFIGVSLFLFLMGNVITSSPSEQAERGPKLGPGYPLLKMFPDLPTTPDTISDSERTAAAEPVGLRMRLLPNLARIFAILSNLAIVVGIVGIGYWHYDNVKTGIGCAVMYLLLPYSAQMTGNLEHTLPASLMVLAMLTYRQPLIAGFMFGLAAGLVYYPLFLLPLWLSFYWNKGLGRLLIGVVVSLCFLSLLLLIQGTNSFSEHLQQMYGLWLPKMEGLEGIWGPDRVPADFRLPVLAACFLLSASFVFWPSRKNLGSLICGTAAIMMAVQFWHGFGGGLYMAWFLPFAVLTIFRPNLDDRIAVNVVK